MQQEAKDSLLRSMFRFKQIDNTIHPIILKLLGVNDISMSEIGLLKGIEHNTPEGEDNTYMSEMPLNLFITKAAVSQMLTSLEKKGYINRMTDSRNRRKQILTLTEAGREMVKKSDECFEIVNERIFSAMGEDEVVEMTVLFNRFADILDEIKSSF